MPQMKIQLTTNESIAASNVKFDWHFPDPLLPQMSNLIDIYLAF